MTNDEIAKLAREYAEEATKADAGDPNLSATDLNGIKRDVAEYAEQVISWLLRTHCIVSKEKVNEAESEVISGWVARDMDGEIYLYENKPERGFDEWLGGLSSKFDFQKITWSSDPIEVEITIKPKKK